MLKVEQAFQHPWQDMIWASTIIRRDSRDASRQKLDPATRTTMNRLRIINHRTQGYTPTDKNRGQAFNELNILKHKLGLSDPAVREDCLYL